jgi:phosphatidylglycerol---prolipoprotein diacylglyceryl transferase
MVFPVTISVGKLTLLLHPVMEAAAYFVGARYFLYLKRKNGDPIEEQKRIWIFIGAIFGALIGSRLIGSLERPGELFVARDLLDYIFNNKTVLGGFLGGLFGVEVTKWIIKEKHSSGDLMTYPIILALIIGRIGCFSMGVFEETYGTPTTFFTGMDLGDGIMRHPVALYEIFFLISLWIFLIQLEKRVVLAEGGRFKIFLIAYMLYRFAVDFIKPSEHIIFGLSTIQLTSIAGLIYYYSYIFQPKKLVQNA